MIIEKEGRVYGLVCGQELQGTSGQEMGVEV